MILLTNLKEKDYLNNELAKVYKQQKVIVKLFKDIMNSALRLVLICRQKIFGIMGRKFMLRDRYQIYGQVMNYSIDELCFS